MSVFKALVNPVSFTPFYLEIELPTIFMYEGPNILYHYS